MTFPLERSSWCRRAPTRRATVHRTVTTKENYYNPVCFSSAVLQTVSAKQRIFPRPIQVSTGHLNTPVCALVPAFQIRPPHQKKKSLILTDEAFLFLAEKEGFEPSIPFWGIHDFQSCALGQLRDFSMCVQLLPTCI